MSGAVLFQKNKTAPATYRGLDREHGQVNLWHAGQRAAQNENDPLPGWGWPISGSKTTSTRGPPELRWPSPHFNTQDR